MKNYPFLTVLGRNVRVWLAMTAMMAATWVYAQPEQGDFNFEVRIGAGMSTLSSAPDTKQHFGFEWDLVAEYMATDELGLALEFRNEYLGTKFKIDREDLRLDYISVPLLAKYHITPWLAVQAGPQMGFLVKAKNGGIGISNDCHKVEFSIPMGIALTPFAFKNGDAIVLDLRYRLGLTNVYKNTDYTDGNNWCNRAVQLTIGYRTDFIQ